METWPNGEWGSVGGVFTHKHASVLRLARRKGPPQRLARNCEALAPPRDPRHESAADTGFAFHQTDPYRSHNLVSGVAGADFMLASSPGYSAIRGLPRIAVVWFCRSSET